ncbi:MAG TPA: hypothetical protein VEW42_01390 [Candidatus Eisenbacteria bacterium]|nr:hypothetical protein [Candidatus Eisenbacteria bacterium]
MPKHKKTREQKKKADERKSLSFAHHQEGHVVSSPTYVFSSSKKTDADATPTVRYINAVAIVQHDLKKTAFISLSILALQILFFLLLKNHLLAINFVRY